MFTPKSPCNALGRKTARFDFMVEAFEVELEAPPDLPCPDEETSYSLERWGVATRQCMKELAHGVQGRCRAKVA